MRAAYTITEECERLFCEDLRAIFLGETEEPAAALVVGAYQTSQYDYNESYDGMKGMQMAMPDDVALREDQIYGSNNKIGEYMEMWDYTGGARFRGFTSDDEEHTRTLFVFFDEMVIGKELKQAYVWYLVLTESSYRLLTYNRLMALIELASTPSLSCDHLVVCVQRPTSNPETHAVIRDLGWVGFEPITLERWTRSAELTSRKWVFLGMEV